MLNLKVLIARVSSPRNVIVGFSRVCSYIYPRNCARPSQLGSKRPKVFNTFSCFYGGWHSLFFIVSSPAASLSLRLFLSFSRWNAHKSPSMSEEERREERLAVSPLWCTTWRSAWKKSHKPVKKHGISELEGSRGMETRGGVGRGRGSSIAKGIPLMTNHAWFSFVFPLPLVRSSPSLPSLLYNVRFTVAALPDSPNARFFTFVSALFSASSSSSFPSLPILSRVLIFPHLSI